MDDNLTLARIIEKIYPGYPLLELWDSEIPVHVIRTPDAQLNAPQSVLGAIDLVRKENIDPVLLERGDEHVKRLLEEGVPLQDLPTYCLESLDRSASGSISMTCYAGTYFNMLRTCEILKEELEKACILQGARRIPARGETDLSRAIRGEESSHDREYSLPLRYGLPRPESGGSRLFAQKGISGAIGISALIVFRKDRRYFMLLGERRGSGVAIGRGGIHVLPACMFQPVSGAAALEYDIPYNVYREYLEELFSIEAEVKAGGPVRGESNGVSFSKERVLANPNVDFLIRLIDTGKAGLYFTGITLNLLTLRVDVDILILMLDEKWYSTHKNGSSGLSRFAFNSEWNKLLEIELSAKSKDYNDVRLMPSGINPCGAGAVFLGLDCLGRVL